MSNRPNIYLNSSDSLSTVLNRLQLSATLYVSGEFCGAWAIDTSGSRRMPFHLVGRGQAWLHIAGEPSRALSPGDLVLFPRDKQHVMSNSAEVPPEREINAGFDSEQEPNAHLSCGFFEFKSTAAWPLLDSLPSVIVLDLSDMGATPQVRTLIDLMVGELQGREPGFYTAIDQLAYLLFVQIIRQQINSGQVNSGLLAAMFDERIGRTLAAIHNHPELRWNLDSLAKEAAMGRSSFAKRFHDLAGTTAMQYLTAWRMQEAIYLLESGSLSIAEISERCGYESEPAFRKAFRKTIGKPPGSFRGTPHPAQ
jgi:AraC-like DNA-binding protein